MVLYLYMEREREKKSGFSYMNLGNFCFKILVNLETFISTFIKNI